MKRSIRVLLLAMALCLALCGCKSKEATNADNMILEIGDVTLDSESKIVAAENAVKELSGKDYEQLENLRTLNDARSTYDELMREKPIRDTEKKINEIGTVSMTSKQAIADAEAMFEALPEEDKKSVSNYQVLVDAKEKLEKVYLDEMEKDTKYIAATSVFEMAMKAYNPRMTLNREERVLYLECTADADSTDAIFLLPGLSRTLFQGLKNSMTEISNSVYIITKEYDVDAVVIMYGAYNMGKLMEIKNGEVVSSVM
jgi:hypothetical protein